ncbi:MAG TPA: histidine phosphatase family protein [Anaerolineae bacterium]|nr:histidine phosphatase family protein [Anaerolineae bacterium]
MTQLYLIRHGRQLSADAPDDQWLSEEQNALSERGHDQARRLGQYLAARIKPDVLYASPIVRAQQTAQAVSDATGLPIQFDDRLREIRLNLPSDIAPNQIMEVWLNTRRYVDVPVYAGGEAWLGLQRRTVEVIDAIVAAHPDRKVAVVAHGGVIETLFFHFLGIPIERNLQAFVNIHHTGIFHWRNFQIGEYSGWELLIANDTRHLD